MTTTSLRKLRKRKVVDTSTAETLGRVRDVHIDPGSSRVAALAVKGGTSGVVAFADLHSLGPDAVTVADAGTVAEGDHPSPTASDAIGSRLLDEDGRHLGKVEDLAMDEDGRIVAVEADGTTMQRTLLGIGSFAVVVSREPSAGGAGPT